MSRKRRSKTAWQARARGALVVLALAAVGCVALVKFVQSPRSNVFLLDLGVSSRYGAVQDSIGAALSETLARLDLDGRMEESAFPASVGRGYSCREWTLEVPRSQSLIRLNLALSEAIRDAGGRVRSSREWRDEAGLTLEAGSRRHSTHRLVIHRGAGGAYAARPSPEGSEGPDEDAEAGDIAARKAAGASADDLARELSHSKPGRSRLALVIDDFGYSRGRIIEDFLALDIPVTVSVIPTLPHSRYVLERAAAAGKQAILHLPMEAEAYESDIPGVMTAMSREEIETLVGEYLDETSGVVGVNNHLGSAATQDARVMEAVLRVVDGRDLFFLDSLTSSKSIAYTTARRLGVPTARNDVFIDAATEDEAVVTERLNRLLDIARDRGTAVGIGHPRPWTLQAIKACRERAGESGIEFVFVSAVVE